MKRNRRAGVEDRWSKTVRDPDGSVQTVPSARHGKGKRWNARYVDDHGREHGKVFATKSAAQHWLDGQTTALGTGTHVAPKDARVTVAEWCESWLEGYQVHRKTTVIQAQAHISHIVAAFGERTLSAVRPSEVKTWVAGLSTTLEPSYVYAIHSRLSQICSDAVHDGLLGRNPCGRRTAPPMGKPKVYVATTEQVWALYDVMPGHLRAAVLLGAFAGLRISEVCALKVADVDFIRGIVHPHRQWPDRPLKTDGSEAPIPIPRELTLLLAESVRTFGGEWLLPRTPDNTRGDPRVLGRTIRQVRGSIEGLPEMFSYHDLRHYLASLLIASGADIKTVQARLRHESAKTTLDTYGHLWPDADESTRAAVGKVIRERLGETAARPLRDADT
jgi:integrase